MIVDVHSHLYWYPDHIDKDTAQEALDSKLVKLRVSGGRAHVGSLDLHSYDSTPATHWEASATADRVIVFGIQARASGIWVPNDLIADYVRQHPTRLEGWASINPADPGALNELERCVTDLGLKGVKVGPAYQHWDPRDESHWPFFERCQLLNLPVLIHQGATPLSRSRLDLAKLLLLEPLVMRFRDLRLIIAHLGHPWEEDVTVLMRKAPNVFADVSAAHYRPWRYWQSMITAVEYGVTGKLLLGSDFPSGKLEDVITGLRTINDVIKGTSLPRVEDSVIEGIINDNWRVALQA